MKTVDVIIPTYRPGAELEELLRRLGKQRQKPEHIYVVNTEERFWNTEWEERYPGLSVTHIRKKDFDHGGTRKKMAEMCKADLLLFMTQDALPADANLISELAAAFENEKAGAAYARQLPKKDCGLAEAYTREFNYPPRSRVKSKEDLEILGIKTFFCSDVCAAYDREIYEALGGFVEKTIFNEDMIFARRLIDAGYQIVYQAGARVYHSHNYRAKEQFRRNFDLGVSQTQYREVFEGIPSEGEGIRMVKKTIAYLWKQGNIDRIPGVIFQNACKYAGYLLGKHYRMLPEKMVFLCTMNRGYWEKK